MEPLILWAILSIGYISLSHIFSFCFPLAFQVAVNSVIYASMHYIMSVQIMSVQNTLKDLFKAFP